MNSETIRKAIQNIIVISDFKTKAIEDYWNNELAIINNLNFGLSRDGAEKEIKSLIDSFKIENEINDFVIDTIQKGIKEYFDVDKESEISKLFNNLLNIAILEDIRPGINEFSFNSLEGMVIDIVSAIYDYIILYQNSNRYLQTEREQQSNIKNLENVKDLASKFNNQKLINELNNMIELISKEDFITKEIIIKSCFFTLHNILVRKFPKTTKAKDYANSLIQSFFNTNKQYKSSNKIDKKVFFENGSQISREFFYYKS